MARKLKTLLLLLALPLCVAANEWNAQLYRQIEQSIQMPQFADNSYIITNAYFIFI